MLEVHHEVNAFFIVGTAFLIGVILQLISHRIQIPAIVLLLIGGLIVGPECLNLIDPGQLDQQLLKFIISIAIAIILFEGGLGLDIDGFRQSPAVIRRLLSLGVIITWLGIGFSIHFLYQFPLNLSLLAGSLVIVTGPTVIQPILRRILIKEKLHHILHWESVLVDPVGIFIAILSLEWVLLDVGGGQTITQTITDFGLRFGLGLLFGVVGGLSLDFFLRKNRIDLDQVNMTVLGGALFLFGVSDYLLPESGLLTVTVAGFLLGYKNPPRLKQVTQFKKELTEMSLSVLFILLAANLKFDAFERFLLDDFRGITLIIILLFVIRPISILLCTIGRAININEKIFLSWIAPRGIVAASMASLFALTLRGRDFADVGNFIEAFVYSVIGITVILQGLSAGIVARLTSVTAPKRQGWLIVGAHRLGREIAHFLKDKAGVSVFIIDTNIQTVKKAKNEHLHAEVANANDKSLFEKDAIINVGHVLALTENYHLNKVICQTWSEIIDHDHLYRWTPGHDDLDESMTNQGHPILTEITNPLLLNWELKRGQSKFSTEPTETRSNSHQTKVIMSLKKDNSAVFGLSKDDEDVSKQLYLHRSQLNLVHLTRSEIITKYHHTNKRQLLEEIVNSITKIYPKVNHQKLLDDIIKREEAYATSIGNGVAVPHTYCDTLDESICAIAQIPKGVQYDAHDQKPIFLIFLLASPPGDPEHHLKILGEIAALASNAQLVESLVNAPHASDVINLIEESGEKRLN